MQGCIAQLVDTVQISTELAHSKNESEVPVVCCPVQRCYSREVFRIQLGSGLDELSSMALMSKATESRERNREPGKEAVQHADQRERSAAHANGPNRFKKNRTHHLDDLQNPASG